MRIRSAATKAILHDYLGLRMIACRSVPYFLTEAQKREHVDYCLKMLETFDSGRSIRVHNIITGDESQFYYYDLQMKHYCQVSMASNSPPPAKVLRQ